METRATLRPLKAFQREGWSLAARALGFPTPDRVDAAAGAALGVVLARGAVREPATLLAPRSDVGLRRAAHPAIAEQALAAAIVRHVAWIVEVEATLLRPGIWTPDKVSNHAEAAPSGQHPQQVAARTNVHETFREVIKAGRLHGGPSVGDRAPRSALRDDRTHSSHTRTERRQSISAVTVRFTLKRPVFAKAGGGRHPTATSHPRRDRP